MTLMKGQLKPSAFHLSCLHWFLQLWETKVEFLLHLLTNQERRDVKNGLVWDLSSTWQSWIQRILCDRLSLCWGIEHYLALSSESPASLSSFKHQFSLTISQTVRSNFVHWIISYHFNGYHHRIFTCWLLIKNQMNGFYHFRKAGLSF